MSRAVICDVCSKVCQDESYFSLSGWQGKGVHYPAKKRKDEAWAIEQRQDIDGLAADICSDCLEQRLNIVSLNRVKTRETLRKEIQAQNPHMSPLALLRQVVGISSTSVVCDRCQSECMDKHLLIKSGWITEQGEELMAELCEPCVRADLMGVVQFQKLSAKQQAPEPSAI
jgi:hypothetical protein